MDTTQVCPLCKSDQRSVFEHVTSFGFDLTYYQCQNCALIFQAAGESQAADPNFYEETYRKVYQAQEEPTAKDLRIQRQRAMHRVQYLQSLGVERINRALDIGASTGIFLETIAKKLQAQIMGVEPGKVYRHFAEARGITMAASIDDLLQMKPERFDLVSMMHVLEHLPDPLQALSTIRESLLNPDGYLLIEVPNFYAHDSYELAHLTCFTPHSLREMLLQSGYYIINEQKSGFPRSKILNLYLTILAKPAQSGTVSRALIPDRQVRLKRDLAMFYRKVVQKVFPGLAWQPIEPQEKR